MKLKEWSELELIDKKGKIIRKLKKKKIKIIECIERGVID